MNLVGIQRARNMPALEGNNRSKNIYWIGSKTRMRKESVNLKIDQ